MTITIRPETDSDLEFKTTGEFTMYTSAERNKLRGWLIGVVCAVLFITVAAHAQQAAQQTTVTASGQALADTGSPALPMKIPVLVVKCFPVKGDRIDIAVTGDWGAPLQETRTKTSQLTKAAIQALQDGSRYHGYKDAQARPSLAYQVIDEIEYLEPMPTLPRPGNRVPLTDYRKIMERVQIRKWVEERSVKEVWIWGYHGGVLDLWESNMASPYGDISNSNRDPNDLPVLKSTYTVYHYNYQRGVSEAVEDHMHQLEAVLNYVDGRDRTPPDKWSELLFWGKFVGSDRSHKIVRPGCGWSHYPPNAAGDYDWANKRFVETDIEDWKPDGTGTKQRINCDRWQGDSLKWFVYWTQNIPGADNGLSYQDQPLTNWWVFIGDFDYAMQRKMTLVERAAQPGLEKAVYVPKHLDDCLAELKKLLPKAQIEEMKNGSEKDMIQYHHGLGTWLRNNWGLWKGSRLSTWFNEKGIRHPDDMSGIILDSFWRHLNGRPIKLDDQVKHYQDYWKKSANQGRSSQQAITGPAFRRRESVRRSLRLPQQGHGPAASGQAG